VHGAKISGSQRIESKNNVYQHRAALRTHNANKISAKGSVHRHSSFGGGAGARGEHRNWRYAAAAFCQAHRISFSRSRLETTTHIAGIARCAATPRLLCARRVPEVWHKAWQQ